MERKKRTKAGGGICRTESSPKGMIHSQKREEKEFESQGSQSQRVGTTKTEDVER